MAKKSDLELIGEDVTPPKVIESRNWAFIAYQESVVPDWLDILTRSYGDGERVCSLVSPLHDSDIDELGNLKKPHYHILVMFKSAVAQSTAERFSKLMKFVGCERVRKRVPYARYLCHLDNPDKHKYNIDDVKSFGCDYRDVIGSSDDKYTIIREIIDFINSSDILFYSDLVDYCKDNNNDWFVSLMSGATFNIEKYIRERRIKFTYSREHNYLNLGYTARTTTREVSDVGCRKKVKSSIDLVNDYFESEV